MSIHRASVAGQFYPNDPDSLKTEIDTYLSEASSNPEENFSIQALMVPHAGYIYSGSIAALAYNLIRNKEYKRVFLICNSHTSYFEGVAIDECNAWQTPLGEVMVDQNFIKAMRKKSHNIIMDSTIHRSDHVLEVQLPFLQMVIKNDFSIVPILFGNAHRDDYKIMVEVIKNQLHNDDLIVISSDMSHYPLYDDARQIDSRTLELIKERDMPKLEKHILDNENEIPNAQTLLCGIDGVKLIMELSKTLDWRSKILGYANSGDSMYGNKEQVVGYGAMVWYN